MSEADVISREIAADLLERKAGLTTLQIEQFLGRRETIGKETIDKAIKLARRAKSESKTPEAASPARRIYRHRPRTQANAGRMPFKVAVEEARQFAELEVQ